MQSNLQKIFNLLLPSGLGLVVYVALAGILLVLHQFNLIQQFLGLPRNIQFAQIFKDWLDVMLNGTLGQGRTEVFVVGFFWAIVGLGVYFLLRGLAKAIYDLGESIDERGYVWPKGTNRYRPLVNTIERIGFRVVIALVIVFWVLQPVARVLDGPVFKDALSSSQILQYAAWFGMSMLTLHTLTVLLRLFALRERLFD